MSYALIDYDDEALEDLLAVVNPDDHDKVVLGAITQRYPYPHPLGVLAQDIAEGWGYTQEELFKQCRSIWASGFRPTRQQNVVGSAHDTKEDSHDHQPS